MSLTHRLNQFLMKESVNGSVLRINLLDQFIHVEADSHPVVAVLRSCKGEMQQKIQRCLKWNRCGFRFPNQTMEGRTPMCTLFSTFYPLKGILPGEVSGNRLMEWRTHTLCHASKTYRWYTKGVNDQVEGPLGTLRVLSDFFNDVS